MQNLKKGLFFGVNKRQADYHGLTVADTEYIHRNDVPWHFHENPHFVYFLKGHVVEVTKKNSYGCNSQTIVFHNWQEAHRNSNHSDYMRCFHIEFNKIWLQNHRIHLSHLEGSKHLNNAIFQGYFNQLYREFHINDSASSISIEGLMLQIFGELTRRKFEIKISSPEWVDKLKEVIHGQCEDSLSLTSLANEVGLHPTYLPQVFPKYFNTTFGEYVRRIRIDKAASLLKDKHLTLTKIAFACGFSDQSHFIRSFRQINGMTPTAFRKIILSTDSNLR